MNPNNDINFSDNHCIDVINCFNKSGKKKIMIHDIENIMLQDIVITNEYSEEHIVKFYNTVSCNQYFKYMTLYHPDTFHVFACNIATKRHGYHEISTLCNDNYYLLFYKPGAENDDKLIIGIITRIEEPYLSNEQLCNATVITGDFYDNPSSYFTGKTNYNLLRLKQIHFYNNTHALHYKYTDQLKDEKGQVCTVNTDGLLLYNDGYTDYFKDNRDRAYKILEDSVGNKIKQYIFLRTLPILYNNSLRYTTDSTNEWYYIDDVGHPYYLDRWIRPYDYNEDNNIFYKHINAAGDKSINFFDSNHQQYYICNGEPYYLDKLRRPYKVLDFDHSKKTYFYINTIYDSDKKEYYISNNGTPFYLNETNVAYNKSENGEITYPLQTTLPYDMRLAIAPSLQLSNTFCSQTHNISCSQSSNTQDQYNIKYLKYKKK